MDNRNQYDEDEQTPTFLERHRLALSLVALVVIGLGGATLVKKLSAGAGSSRKGPEMVSVRLPPPAPTPPPPAATPPPAQEVKQEQKMVEQSPVDEHEEKPKDEPPPSAAISTGIKGDGNADGFGVGGGNGNGMIGGGAGRQHSKWGWYAGIVQSGISDVLRRNPKLRSASLNLKVRIWSDTTGRVTRAKISGDSSDPKTEQAIQDALMGVQLKEAPPVGMPQPIVMRVIAKRPN